MFEAILISIGVALTGGNLGGTSGVKLSEIHLVDLVHGSVHCMVRKDSAFPFTASVEKTIDSRGDLFEIFLGPKAKWKEGGWTACDCNDSWYKVRFHVKNQEEPIVIEVSPCSEEFKDAVLIAKGSAYTMELTPLERRKLKKYFSTLVEQQKLIQESTGTGGCQENPCLRPD